LKTYFQILPRRLIVQETAYYHIMSSSNRKIDGTDSDEKPQLYAIKNFRKWPSKKWLKQLCPTDQRGSLTNFVAIDMRTIERYPIIKPPMFVLTYGDDYFFDCIAMGLQQRDRKQYNPSDLRRSFGYKDTATDHPSICNPERLKKLCDDYHFDLQIFVAETDKKDNTSRIYEMPTAEIISDTQTYERRDVIMMAFCEEMVKYNYCSCPHLQCRFDLIVSTMPLLIGPPPNTHF
jgi:hypothetical protein